MSSAVESGYLVSDFIAKAKELVEESGLKRPPIEPLKLARLRGIQRVVLSRTIPVSGQLLQEGRELIVRLNASEPRERQNFTLCHELAHTFVLDTSLAKFRQNPVALTCSRASLEERLCDRAAAEMLMPEKFFRPMAASLEPSVSSLICLARTFASSIRATIVRLGQLGVWPVVLVGWRFAARPGSSPKLRVSWSVRPQGSRCLVPLHAPADPGSGMYATFVASRPTCETESLNLGSLRGKYLVENVRFGHYVVSIIHDPKLRRRV